jgi:methionyl aminopeptidase
MIERNDLCWCGSGKKWKKCHYPAVFTDRDALAKSYLQQYGIIIKTPEQIQKIKKACQVAKNIVTTLVAQAQEGVTTDELNRLSDELHREAHAIAAPLNYGTPPFPKGICTSVNDVICHGIPDAQPLKQGDIVNIDVTSIVDGYYGDTSKMAVIEPIDHASRTVVDVAKECLLQSIVILKPGLEIREIGAVIEKIAAEHGCSVVNQFVGHGVGVRFHEPPQIFHNYNNCKIPLVPGMVFTIEPMINAGHREAVIDSHDQWTARTIDGKPSAQWEHTVCITDTGYEILTE